MKKIISWFGRGLRSGLVAIGALAFTGSIIAIANYTMTQGAGTTFGSVLVSGAHYVQMLLCDPVTPANCVTTQSANAHVAPDVVINDASGNRLNGLTIGTFGVPSANVVSVQNNDPCSYAAKSSAAISVTSATTTSLVAVSGATAVYVCGFSFTISEVVTTANTLQFEYGTGAACTSPTVLTGLYGAGGVTAGDPIVISAGNAGATVIKAPASNGICALTAIGGSASFQGVLTYVQQ